jgi:hypothetical protein
MVIEAISNLHSLYFIFRPQSTILSLYFVKSQLNDTIASILVCLGLGLVNFSESLSLSHETPYQLHTNSRSTSYVYKDFQCHLQWLVVIRMQPHSDICLVHSHRLQWRNTWFLTYIYML